MHYIRSDGRYRGGGGGGHTQIIHSLTISTRFGVCVTGPRQIYVFRHNIGTTDTTYTLDNLPAHISDVSVL